MPMLHRAIAGRSPPSNALAYAKIPAKERVNETSGSAKISWSRAEFRPRSSPRPAAQPKLSTLFAFSKLLFNVLAGRALVFYCLTDSVCPE